MKKIIHTGLVLSAIIALLVRCGQEPSAVTGIDAALYQGVVTNISAVYLPDSGRVRLSWSRPAGDVQAFIVFRTNTRDIYGNVNLSTLEPQVTIDGSQTTYSDIIGIANTVYFYSVKAVVLDPVSGDSVAGPMSKLDSCDVGSKRYLAINYGDIFLTTDNANLVLIDKLLQIESVQFTDSIKKGTGTAVDTPVFVSSNPRNAQLTYTPMAGTVSTVYPWILPQGGGAKKVAALVKIAGGTTDTLIDDIKIKPYRLTIKLRNPIEGNFRSMVIPSIKGSTDAGLSVPQYNVCKPLIDYSISIFSDTTFAKEFDFWVVVPDSSDNAKVVDVKTIDSANGKKYNKLPGTRYYWLETNPVHDSLTGFGSSHNDQKVYKYSIDPDSVEGKRNLSTFTRTGVRPATAKPIDQFSESGRFWGIKDTALREGTYIDSCKTFLNQNPYYTFSRIKGMSAAKIALPGVKEIAMVVRMKGRYFNENRTFISTPSVNKDAPFITNLGLYPPLVSRDAFEFVFPFEASVIRNSFSINTNKTGTAGGVNGDPNLTYRGFIKCYSEARVAAVDLIIAKMPDYLVRTWVADKTWSTIRLDSLLAWPHRVLPYEMSSLLRTLPGASWSNIDVSTWASGDYLVAIRTEDEFGNYGIAPYGVSGANLAGTNTNPQRWQIVTGQ